MVKRMKQTQHSLMQCIQTCFKFVAFAILWSFSALVFANSITVESDRQTVEFGDIVTLKITADFQVITGQLDLSKLDDQFEVLG